MRHGCSNAIRLVCTWTLITLQSITSASQSVPNVTPALRAETAASAPAPRPAPELRYLGSYRPNGEFKSASKLACAGPEAAPAPARAAEVPGWVDLRNQKEALIENLAPPNHARRVIQSKARPQSVLGFFATVAYGHETLLHTPARVVLDSQRRIILTDRSTASIQVLDDKRSFRIAGGAGRRLVQPNGLAVDKSDNIYVADGKMVAVLVYGADGTFLRSIGTLSGGESVFHEPTGIAIDRRRALLYVLDSPSDELFVFDLNGRILQRVGGRRFRSGVHFEFPTEIAVRDSDIAVLDSFGGRVQIFDAGFNLLSTFRIRSMAPGGRVPEMGLAMDAAGYIYISNGLPGVRIYHRSGKLVSNLNNCGIATPGIWSDWAGRIYLADPSAGRILLYQESSGSRSVAGNTTASPEDGLNSK